MTSHPETPFSKGRRMLNKVPEVTLYFWLIKVLCTTVGETASDYLATNLNLGLTKTTFITGALLLATLVFQFRARRYVPGIYWLGVVLISVVGTQITDNLTDNPGVSLGTTVTSAIFLSAILVVVVFLSITRRDIAELPVDHHGPAAQVLVVAHKTAATPALLDTIRARAARGRAEFHLLVPNPSGHAELTDEERALHHTEGEHVLALALPLIEEASGGAADGTVPIRHDPMDAIEEHVRDGEYDEIILSTLPRNVSRWLHVDLPGRVAHLGLPVTTVVAAGRASA